MKKLCDCKWKAFVVGGLFNIKIGKNLDKIHADMSGDKPYVTRTVSNNGVEGFVSAPDDMMTQEGPVITIGNETAQPFVQVFSFCTGTKVNILKSKVKISRYALLFVSRCLEQHKTRFSYSFTANSTRLKELSIMLPVNSKGDPDYTFMEEYMRTMEAKLLAKYKAHLDELLKLDVSCGGGQKLADKKWRGFEVTELFKIESGKRLESRCMKRGLRPFVGAADSGNGVTNFISNTNASLDSHVLGVNYNGNGMGIGFYHPYEALFSDDVKRFHLKNYPDDKYVMLFLKVAILKQKPKFDYGYKFNAERMNRQRLFLPVDSNGNPDYEFMRDYMRKEERKIIVSMIERLAAEA